MSMPAPNDSGLFPDGVNMCDQTNGFHSSNVDLFAPIPIGRGSGTGSPASLEATPTPGAITTFCSSDSTSNCSGSAEDASKSFPIVLHTIISEVDSDCIHWLPCGTRFVIADKDVFSRDILPRYFGGRGGATTKFTSFTRRLKRWNFSRVPSGREMGAYYHLKFRRGEVELAKTITYPLSKSVNKSPPGSKGSAKPGRPVIPKARRRASTGSIMPPTSTATSSVKSAAAAVESISPTPIKNSLNVANIPLPMLENDMKKWLSSADFMEEGGSSTNNSNSNNNNNNNSAPSTNAETDSLVSDSFLLPPPAFPYNVMSSGGFQAEGSESMKPMSMRPGMAMMRRHSMTAPHAVCMPMMATSNSVASSFNSSQQLGTTSFPHNNEVLMNAPNNIMSFTSDGNLNFPSNNNSVPTTMTMNRKESPQPEHIISTGSVDDSSKEPFSMSREFSFGDLKMIDPFT
eukprot:CAMPEP_0196136976 /NCGR_PEP_ID=MMETSP0910-20130528/5107_1 /TAXON_ID=49265 /ORGANISM="Thalassiosira rotula, Strain GSO102" /LENGTH=457 /DNA_ID=CAMNT_0041397353 /DNA_START=135 /DNA_END=1508 /DNA_ORIENTATION=-